MRIFHFKSASQPEQKVGELEDPLLVVRSVSLIIIAVVAVIFALYQAANFFITLLLGIFLAYTLNPIVNWLHHLRIPRVIGSSITMISLVALVSVAAIGLKGQVDAIIAQLPSVSKKFTSLVVTKKNSPLTNMQKVQIAATHVENATSQVDGGGKKNTTMQVTIKEQPIKLSDYVWRGSLGFAGFVAQLMTVIFLAYFLLISGDTFKRKLVKLTGPTMTHKKITLNILQDINQSIQSYMLMLLVTNALVAALMWGMLTVFSLENAGAWAVASGIAHFIPYFGPLVTAVAIAMAAFMQFDSVVMAVLMAGATLIIAMIVGVFITTWMTGRIAKMNSAAIFISLLFFTWLWGFWGALLGIPVVVLIKVTAERIESWQPLAEILGE